MRVLLLAGYQSSLPSDALLPDEKGRFKLDGHIDQLLAMGIPLDDITVVLGGADSEDILRRSRRIESCELIYDTNGSEVSLTTNLRAGLAAFTQPILVLKVSDDYLGKRLYLDLLSIYHQNPSARVLGGGDLPTVIVRPQDLLGAVSVRCDEAGKLVTNDDAQNIGFHIAN